MTDNRGSRLEDRAWTTNSPAETRALGARLVQQLAPGSVVALHGDLGAGKTQFAKGVAGALGLDERDVRSPTFVIAREYASRWPEEHPHAGAAVPFYHLDAYRLGGPGELEGIGYDEYFFGDGICLVEWPERVEPLLPDDTIHLHLQHLGSDRRRVVSK
jgi:tRNA threonylcarbamoyladenosine biosynthesis protein TsaE